MRNFSVSKFVSCLLLTVGLLCSTVTSFASNSVSTSAFFSQDVYGSDSTHIIFPTDSSGNLSPFLTVIDFESLPLYTTSASWYVANNQTMYGQSSLAEESYGSVASITMTLPTYASDSPSGGNPYSVVLPSPIREFSLTLSVYISFLGFVTVGNPNAVLSLIAPDGTMYVSNVKALNNTSSVGSGSTNVTFTFSPVANFQRFTPSINLRITNGSLQYVGENVGGASSAYIRFGFRTSPSYSYYSYDPGSVDSALVVEAIEDLKQALGDKLDGVSSSIQDVQDYLDSYQDVTSPLPDIMASAPTLPPAGQDAFNSAPGAVDNAFTELGIIAEPAVDQVIYGLGILFSGDHKWLTASLLSCLVAGIVVYIFRLLNRSE